jgi:hypothetical protein
MVTRNVTRVFGEKHLKAAVATRAGVQCASFDAPVDRGTANLQLPSGVT